MESFIRALYHGPAPEIDKNLIMTHIGNVESIRWVRNLCFGLIHILVRILQDTIFCVLKEHVKKGFSKIELEIEARKKKQKSMKCTSYSEYRDLAHRHVRSKEGPDERLRKPLTVGQEFGWNIKCVEGPLEIKGRKSCPETIYADELAKSGIIY